MSQTSASGNDLFEDPHVNRLLHSRSMLNGLEKLLFIHIREAITTTRQDFPQYNPYLYESHLTDVSRLLEKCLTYRRECMGLEAQAVQRALEYQLFEDLLADERDLNQELTASEALEAQRRAQKLAGERFAEGSDELKPFAELYRGGAEASGFALENEEKKRRTLNSRLTKLRDHQHRLELRHTTRGHALNYVERRNRVIQLLLQDLTEAYQLARAARAGLQFQLGVLEAPSFPFPSISGDDVEDAKFLDQFVFWARDAIRRYEIETQNDVNFEVTLPIGNPYGPAGAGPKDQVSLVLPGVLLTEMAFPGKGRLVIEGLPERMPTGFRRIRVRGVAASIGWTETDAGDHLDRSGRVWSVTVQMPDQLNPIPSETPDLDPVRSVKRSPAVLGRVGVFRYDASPIFSSGPEVWNADLSAGNLILQVGDLVVTGEEGKLIANRGFKMSDTGANDVKLHLRLVGTPALS